MSFNPHIFKAYDIRGKYPAELDEDTAKRIGNAHAVFCARQSKKEKVTILLCRDIRLSSPALHHAMIEGITESGSRVIDAGIATTPLFYFLVHMVKCDGGIMITASHNPAEYNGMKMLGKAGASIAEGTGIEKIRDAVIAKTYSKGKEFGTIETPEDRRKEYADYLVKKNTVKEIRVVVDACGGAPTYVLPAVLEKIPSVIYKPLFFEPDGSFKKHSPNPLDPKAQRFVTAELRNGSYAFGAVFDGDGDRIVFFDEKGNRVLSEFVAGLFVDAYLKKEKGAVLVLPPNTSRGVREYIVERGGRIKLSRVGYALIQPVMKKIKAPFGVEISGHFHFREFFYRDSGVLALIKLAEILSHTARPLSQLVVPMQRYITSGEVNFSVHDKETVLEAIETHYRELRDAKISKVDGVSVDFPDWWFNIRESNTEPLVRLVLEAKTKELFTKKFEEVKRFLR